ncbi:MAG: tryptophan-rich sensory protein [Sphingobium sp.]|nr:tryptophan-rich sensory protein [Sphingobium sp.]
MSEIASKGQLRLSFLRWAMVAVPSVAFLGLLSGLISGNGADNPWYAVLAKPTFMPPSWVFGAVWPVLYLLIGLALAIVLNARRALGRGLAITLFLVQLACNLVWSPLFFGAHEVALSAYLSAIIFVLAALTTVYFARIRPVAALLMLPYVAWLAFASVLAYQVHSLNPDAEGLVPPAAHTQI